jgi:threonine dehydrogenase-like Zn-dependent dehydrogenase
VGVAVIGCGTIGTLRAHYAPALAALRAGKHVLAEKPGMVPG